MPSHIFNTQKAQQASNAWTADTLKLALVGTGYAPDPDATTLLAALGANELAGPGYSRKTLAGKSVTIDSGTDEVGYGAADAVYEGANFGAVKGGIVYREVHPTDDAQNIPIAWCELPEPVSTIGTRFTFRFNTGAVLKAT